MDGKRGLAGAALLGYHSDRVHRFRNSAESIQERRTWKGARTLPRPHAATVAYLRAVHHFVATPIWGGYRTVDS